MKSSHMLKGIFVLPLKIENLVKAYGPTKAVNDVSFEVKPGEIFGLLGPNGAGKTSLISTIVTLEKPTSGRVLVFDQDVQESPQWTKSQIGIVPQEIVNHGFFDVMEIMDFQSGYYGLLNNQSRIEELVKRMGLWEHRFKKIRQMSGGMKRRLLIAKALVHRPKLLLLDEPTAGVDIELRSSLWQFIKELKHEGTSILLTTHYLEEAEELCDRVGVLHQGQLLKLGPTQELVERLTFKNIEISGRGLGQLQHDSITFQTDQRVCLTVPSSQEMGWVLKSLQIQLDQIENIHIREGSLEEAFKTIISSRASSL